MLEKLLIECTDEEDTTTFIYLQNRKSTSDKPFTYVTSKTTRKKKACITKLNYTIFSQRLENT